MKICISVCTINDLNALQRLFGNSIRQGCTADYSSEQIDAWIKSVEDKERWLQKIQNQYFIKASFENHILGFASWERPDFLDLLYVDPSHKREGIATLLLTELENYALSIGAFQMVTYASETALPFFQKQGYKIVNRRDFLHNRVPMYNYKIFKRIKTIDMSTIFNKRDIFPKLEKLVADCEANMDSIGRDRKKLLESLSVYIQQKIGAKEEIHLLFICTHNSRRSHFGQVAGALAAAYYEVPKFFTYSGGTEVTRMNINAINALNRAGFEINDDSEKSNPVIEIKYNKDSSVFCFSKLYYDESNPKSHFAALMTCDDADEKCPFIPNAEIRIPLHYEDPKIYDGTEQQDIAYSNRFVQILTEMTFVFSKIK